GRPARRRRGRPSRERFLDELAEEVAALLVRPVVRLHPRTQLPQPLRELDVLPADLRAEAVAELLRERRRGAAGGDGERDRPGAMDGREDDAAELGHVDDVAEERARLGVRVDAPVQRRVRGGGDDEEAAVEVGAPVRAADPLDAELRELRLRLRRDDGDGGAALDEPARLLDTRPAGADD